MPFAATWMDLQIVILSEVSQTEKEKYHKTASMQNLKNDTNELIYKVEADSQTQRMNLWLPGGKGRREGYLGSLGLTCTHCYI